MAKGNTTDSISANQINHGTTITGDITSSSEIRIDGELQGNLVTKGKLVVGEKGKIKGEVTCANSDIEGEIEGKIIVADLLKLMSKAKIIGDIVTTKLGIEAGAIFTGTCSMKGNTTTEPKTLLKK